MGRAARPLHDPGNHGSIERGSNLHAARRGSLRKPARPAGERENTAALTPSPGTRSSWGFPLGAPDRSWLPGMLSEACEALIPLYRIWDTAAVFACSMLSPPLFPARTQYSSPSRHSSEAAVALEALQDSPEQKIQ